MSKKQEQAKRCMDRRHFIKGGLLAGGAAVVASMTGCASGQAGGDAGLASTATASYPEGFVAEDWEESAAIFEPIEDVTEEKTYDIVVVGAGTAGLPAALTALEEGATVCCLQKEAEAVAQGNGSTGIILEASTEYGVQRWIQGHREASSYRANRDLEEFFAFHSGETIMWMANTSKAAGYPPRISLDEKLELADGSYVTTVTNFVGRKPENHGTLVRALAEYAATQGVDLFYETPGVQLVCNDVGAVTGVVAQDKSGAFIRFNANKAVIMATGDFQNNESMVKRLAPDVSHFSRKQFNKTGDGILMVAAVGGLMCNNGSAGKQLHDSDSGPDDLTYVPFLAINEQGERFMNEEVPMESWNQALVLNGQVDAGRFCRVFDNKFTEQSEAWGGMAVDVETLEKYIPGKVENPEGVETDLIDTHCCDTLEELAGELDVPADALVATVKRYNELARAGEDVDFGKQKQYMAPIENPPYWGIRQWVRVSALGCGFKVNGNYQALGRDGEVIPGLYGAGFVAGDLCGDIDWSTFMGGMSCGHCFTSGRYAAIHALTGDLTPSHPANWDEFRVEYLGQEPSSISSGGGAIRLDS